MTQQTETQSVFSFFNGERRLILTAPDDPNALESSRDHTRLWFIETKSESGELLGQRSANGDSSPQTLWNNVSDVLYQTVSSSETDRRTPEIKAWINQIHQAYHARTNRPPTS